MRITSNTWIFTWEHKNNMIPTSGYKKKKHKTKKNRGNSWRRTKPKGYHNSSYPGAAGCQRKSAFRDKGFRSNGCEGTDTGTTGGARSISDTIEEICAWLASFNEVVDTDVGPFLAIASNSRSKSAAENSPLNSSNSAKRNHQWRRERKKK